MTQLSTKRCGVPFKLIIQIPCFNEEFALPVTLAELPRQVAGFESVEWLIIDDGSTDKTVEIARRHGVDHIIQLPSHQGLARAFMAGLEGSLQAGADVILNTDADHQYRAADIPALVAPILSGEAELVIGARPIDEIRHFSWTKRCLQKLGSWVVRFASQTSVPDAPSGFRAMSRNAALQMNVFTQYTYTLETLIQAGRKGMSITSVPIRCNEEIRPSRLVKSTRSYVIHSILTILRIFMTYSPLKFFFYLGSAPFALGVAVGIRWMILSFNGPQASRIPSLVASAILILMGLQIWIFGLVADLLSVNRRLLEDIQLRIRAGS